MNGLCDSLVFRPATAQDADAVADVYLASRRAFVAFAPLAHSPEAVRVWIRVVVIPGGETTVVEENGQVIGMMVLGRAPDANGVAVNWIEHLYLTPGATGRGIGTRLMAQAKATLAPPIRLYTFQQNAGARRFYQREGFVALRFGDGSGNEEGCPDVLYEWR